MDNIHVADGGLFVHAELSDKTAAVTVETTVENQGPVSSVCNVYAVISDRSGNTIGRTKEQEITLGENEKGTLKQKISVNDPRRWSLEDPYLYRVKTIVSSGGHPVDAVETRFGIRTLRFDAAQGFFLNEKHVEIYGTNNHPDHAGLGSALPDYMQYYRIGLLKNMGSNACRTSHNPPTPAFLDACDSLGMLVLDENRLLNSSPEYMSQFERMIIT